MKNLAVKIIESSSKVAFQSLLISVISGLMLVFYYNPIDEHFKSVQEITYNISFGWLIRTVHYISSQVCLISVIGHIAKYGTFNPGGTSRFEVFKLLFTTCLIYVCFFLGYILKGDQEGLFALNISQNLLSQIPYIGKFLMKIFLGDGSNLFIYSYHCYILPILIFLLLKRHVKEIRLASWTIGGIIGLSVFYYENFIHLHDVPLGVQHERVYGPWFFWGIQFLLIHLEVLWAGVIVPSLFFVLLFIGILLDVRALRFCHIMSVVYMIAGIGFRVGLLR